MSSSHHQLVSHLNTTGMPAEECKERVKSIILFCFISTDRNTYDRLKLPELEDSETISVVRGDLHPPSSSTWSPPGSCQHKWANLSVMLARGENSVPSIFEQDPSDVRPPHSKPEQLVWACLPSGKSWRGQELPLIGLNTSTLRCELTGAPPVIKNPGNYIYDRVEGRNHFCHSVSNCQTFGL